MMTIGCDIQFSKKNHSWLQPGAIERIKMKKELVTEMYNSFDEIANETDDGVEFWFARDLQVVLGYKEWRNFFKVISKAKVSCETANSQCSDHFVEVNKMVPIGSGAEKEISDIMLSRYACYLIAQNGDPSKSEIAFAQAYFAFQTRKQELIEERIDDLQRIKARENLTEAEKEFSTTLFEHGVDGKGLGVIRSKGDQALFGGHTTKQMKIKYGIKDNKPLADVLPSVTMTAKQLASELTSLNVKKENMNGEDLITTEHVQNNRNVRGALEMSGVKPEELPPEDDVKKLKKKVESTDRFIKEDTLKK